MAEDRARTHRQALERFIAPLRRVLSLVADPIVTAFQDGNETAVLQFAEAIGDIEASPVRLRGDADLGLLLSQRLRFVTTADPGGPYRMRTEQYTYEIVQHSTGQEIVAFHFGPDGPTPTNPAAAILAPDSHIHLGAASGVNEALQGTHLPTARIAIEDVVLYAIELGWDQGIRPLEGWEDVLVESREQFRRYQTQLR